MKQLREQIAFLTTTIDEISAEMAKVPQDGPIYQSYKRRRDGFVRVRATMNRFLNIGNLLFNDVI